MQQIRQFPWQRVTPESKTFGGAKPGLCSLCWYMICIQNILKSCSRNRKSSMFRQKVTFFLYFAEISHFLLSNYIYFGFIRQSICENMGVDTKIMHVPCTVFEIWPKNRVVIGKHIFTGPLPRKPNNTKLTMSSGRRQADSVST